MKSSGALPINTTRMAGRLRHAVGVFLTLAGSFSGLAQLTVTGLRTELLDNPLGLDRTKPRLSWRVDSEQRQQRQTAYRILVGTTPKVLEADRGDLWDSGKVLQSETLHLPYEGRPLVSNQRVFWKVRVWDRDGRESAWSPTATWGMGLLGTQDWKAQWITFTDETPLPTQPEPLHLPPAHHFRKEFRAGRTVSRATLHFTALGLVEMHLNGKKVGNSLFEPGWADYRLRVHTRTHDVTSMLTRGVNCLGAVLADGWYAGYVGYGLLVGYGPGKTGRNFYGKTPAVMAQLELEYADGGKERVVTDNSWQVSGDGPIREADLIMGETFDARREAPDWCMPGGGKSWKWQPVAMAAAAKPVPAIFHDTRGTKEVDLAFQAPPRLQPYLAPPIRITQQLKAQRLTEPAPGVHIFDMGQNFAGIVRLKIQGPGGTKIRIRHGEMLHSDGRLMVENLRRARATDTYILRGDPRGETWQPSFTYHGFRYVELTGLTSRPDLDTITGLVLHNDTPLTGEFSCSDEVMTQFWRNTQWTQRANFVEIPTDCPQRDERLGWMGDAQIYARTATFNADVAAFFDKWLDDVVEAQRDFGAYPDYAPYPMAHGSPGQTWGTAWTDAGILCPWTMWRVYGDREAIRKRWPSMKRFMDWRVRRSADLKGRADGNSWGDWLNVNEPTPLEYIDAAYFALDAKLMTEMAEALAIDGDADAYRRLHESVRRTFQETYLRPDGTLSVDTQTAYAMAIVFRLVPDDLVERCAEILAGKIAKNDDRMATGFLGTKPLLPALTAGGRHDLALRLFQSRRYPSWGYEVVNGATTVWERWDSYTKEFGFNGAEGNQNASMNSFSHYAFGSVMEWAFRNLAGIDAMEPGYARIAIAPRPASVLGSDRGVPTLSWVKARYDSVRGRIATSWKQERNRFLLEVTIPANTTALVRIPTQGLAQVTESGQPLDQSPGVTLRDRAEGRLAVEIESGTYRFESRGSP
ncbi:MAG: family 78 glycoside hydrolase catalytic domain [Verrucomicrobiales bacterium]|nr:family 78 glycoside hydrolase catalytic domain [Verrucomicrobiales bacterium]